MGQFTDRGRRVKEDRCEAHTPVLSEPSLTLCCATCGAWLLAPNETELVVVPRAEATRGTHVCPRCKAEWTGDSDWCEACKEPTWA